jgi:hypothetical protein
MNFLGVCPGKIGQIIFFDVTKKVFLFDFNILTTVFSVFAKIKFSGFS